MLGARHEDSWKMKDTDYWRFSSQTLLFLTSESCTRVCGSCCAHICHNFTYMKHAQSHYKVKGSIFATVPKFPYIFSISYLHFNLSRFNLTQNTTLSCPSIERTFFFLCIESCFESQTNGSWATHKMWLVSRHNP